MIPDDMRNPTIEASTSKSIETPDSIGSVIKKLEFSTSGRPPPMHEYVHYVPLSMCSSRIHQKACIDLVFFPWQLWTFLHV